MFTYIIQKQKHKKIKKIKNNVSVISTWIHPLT